MFKRLGVLGSHLTNDHIQKRNWHSTRQNVAAVYMCFRYSNPSINSVGIWIVHDQSQTQVSSRRVYPGLLERMGRALPWLLRKLPCIFVSELIFDPDNSRLLTV